MTNYNHKDIEKKWQKEWEEKEIYKTEEKDKGKKFYILDMFPYPSGEGLHVGHPKGYIATDVLSRMKRMQGHSVLHPMGWDAFGLPAENYAIKNKIHPRIAVEKNIERFKEQLAHIGLDYDWSREINTTDPEYYKWTQWIFLKLLEKGLVYESHEPINWCPSCQTGLANEDLEDGKCERCGSVVEKKPMRQWVLRITDYADRLLEDLETLPWPEHIKELQKNWIGRSEGAEIRFKIQDLREKEMGEISVFTTRPDTLFGVTYAVLAPEHSLLKKLETSIHNYDEVSSYIDKALKKEEIERTAEGKEKTGVKIEGLEIVHPATGEKLPLYVADYVLGSYGTGAVMAVPAHDERDFEFARKYELPIKQVIAPHVIDPVNTPQEGKENTERIVVHGIVESHDGSKIISLRWKKFPWRTFITGGAEEGEDIIEAAKREIYEETGYKNLEYVKRLPFIIRADFYAAHKGVNRIVQANFIYFKLQDEVRDEVSEDEKEKHDVEWITFEEVKELSPISELEYVLLWLEKGDYAYTGEGELINSGEYSGLSSDEAREKITEKFGKKVTKYKLRDWVFSRQRYWGEPIPVIHCEKCGVVPVPEDQLPVTLPEVEHYEPTGTGESPLANITDWVHTTCPKCGGEGHRETNTMPQWAGSSWYYLRYMDPHNNDALVDLQKEKFWAPVDVYVGGAEHATRHLIYARFWHKFLYDIGAVSTVEPFKELHSVGLVMAEDGRKMSKRFGNVINPDDVIERFGADSLRLYEMFMGPFENTIAWNTDNLVGVRRFLERVWGLQSKVVDDATFNSEAETVLHKTIKKVSEDITLFKFNTAVSAMMELLNVLQREEVLPKDVYKKFLLILAPFAPHMTEEIWHTIGNTNSIHLHAWPSYDESKLLTKTVTIVIQVNGKVRASMEVETDTPKENIESQAKELASKWLVDSQIKKVIFIPNKLLNFVLA